MRPESGSTVVPAADELVAGSLYALGGFTSEDERLSWSPRPTGSDHPITAYLLVGRDLAVLIDSGVAAHEQIVLGQLAEILGRREPFELVLTRSELDSVGNVAAILRSRPVSAVRTGGLSNPFDAFDSVSSTTGERPRGASGPAAVTQRDSESDGVVLEPGRQLEILPGPLRTLNTFWPYDPATKTLFTSDSFSHAGGLGDGTRLAAADPPPDDEEVRAYLEAKFHWLDRATTTKIAAGLEAVFEQHEIETVAPGHGYIITGREAVGRHYEAVRRALGRSVAPVAKPAIPETIRTGAEPGVEAGRTASLPRRIAPGILWTGGCVEVPDGVVGPRGETMHLHNGCYLVIGERETALVDCGHPRNWTEVERDLDAALAGRGLDWIFPTHPEIPHAGNLNRLMTKFPDATVTGDLRDFHLFYPDLTGRMRHRVPGERIDLGGRALTFLDAPVKDLRGTLWAYDDADQVLFCADAFGYSHGALDGIGAEDPVHSPGECGLLSGELPALPSIEQTVILTRFALFWSRFVDVSPHFDRIDELVRAHPVRLVAPTHGNVISNFERILPVLRAGFDSAYSP